MKPLSELSQVSCESVSDEAEESGIAMRIEEPSCLLTNTTVTTTEYRTLKQNVNSYFQHIEGAWNRIRRIFYVPDSVPNKRKFHEVELFALLILCSSCGNVDCHFHRMPHNVAERVGKQVFMSCASNNTVHPCQNMVWTHYTAHTSIPNVICMGDTVSSLVSDYISIVDLNDGKCNLEIKTQTSAEGKYECTSTTTGERESASLIILDSYPECLVMMFVDETGEYSNITCWVEYFGDWAPTMEWIQMTGQNSNSIRSYGSYTSDQIVSATVVVPLNVSSGYRCIMKFTEQGRRAKITATNVPDYKWTSLIFGEYGGDERSKEKICKEINSGLDYDKNATVVVTVISMTLMILMHIVTIIMLQRQRRHFEKKTEKTAETSLREQHKELQQYELEL